MMFPFGGEALIGALKSKQIKASEKSMNFASSGMVRMTDICLQVSVGLPREDSIWISITHKKKIYPRKIRLLY